MKNINIRLMFAGFVLLPAITFAQTTPSSILTRSLQKGMKGEDVKQLQQMLAADANLYPEGLVTGYFGALTEKAVKAFQQKNGIKMVGNVGPKTLDQLNSLAQSLAVMNSPVAAVKDLLQPEIMLPAPNASAIPEATTTEHYIIRYKQAPGKIEEDSLRSKHKASVRHIFKSIPAIAADMNEKELSDLSNDPSILSVEVDKKIQVQDIEYDNTWGVNSLGASTTQSKGVTGVGIKVAILDTGIDYNHPELSSEYAGGYNFVAGNTNPMDDNGHGTHVAGTIAAAHNNLGVVGMAPGLKIYALKVLDANGSGYASSVIAAIDWAMANGIQITNNSYGSSVDLGTAVGDAFAKADQAGILSVAAAGNSGTCAGDTDTVNYPARYPSVMAIAAVDINNIRPCFSSTGSKVELTAPGVNIVSTKLGGGYVVYNGTSMAAPHVTGTAALVAQAEIAAKQIPTNTSIRKIMDDTATDFGPVGRDTLFGFGFVRADRAVAAVIVTTSTTPTTSTTTLPTPDLPKLSPLPITTQPEATTNSGIQTNPENKIPEEDDSRPSFPKKIPEEASFLKDDFVNLLKNKNLPSLPPQARARISR